MHSLTLKVLTPLGRLHKRGEGLAALKRGLYPAGSVPSLRHLLLLTPRACGQGRWHISQESERRWQRTLAAGRDSTSVNAWDARRSRLRAARTCCKEHARWRPLCFISLDSKRPKTRPISYNSKMQIHRSS